MEDLAAWIEAHGATVEQVATACKCTPWLIRRVRDGRRPLFCELAELIERVDGHETARRIIAHHRDLAAHAAEREAQALGARTAMAV